MSERVPVPLATEPVSLESIALLHTSFLRPDKTSEINDGRTSIVRARVDIEGQDQPLPLNRFIDLRPTGPRL